MRSAQHPQGFFLTIGGVCTAAGVNRSGVALCSTGGVDEPFSTERNPVA